MSRGRCVFKTNPHCLPFPTSANEKTVDNFGRKVTQLSVFIFNSFSFITLAKELMSNLKNKNSEQKNEVRNESRVSCAPLRWFPCHHQPSRLSHLLSFPVFIKKPNVLTGHLIGALVSAAACQLPIGALSSMRCLQPAMEPIIGQTLFSVEPHLHTARLNQ